MVNDRQFYIDQEKECHFSDWKCHYLPSGFYIHYHPQLSTFFHKDFALLGHAWQVDPTHLSPAEELIQLGQKDHTPSLQEIYDIEKSWCGRYLLIIGDWILLDACGLINIFYDDHLICSSLNVLCSVENRTVKFPRIEHRKSPDFIPGMQTPYEGVKRLMPSQILSLTTKEWIIRPLLADPIPSYKNENEGIEYLSKLFIHSVSNLAKVFNDHDIWVASTAGRDSRTTIALLIKAGIKFNTFTLWHSNIPLADHLLPLEIAKLINCKYLFIKRTKKFFSQQRHEDYQEHTAGMAIDEDWRFYAYNQYPSLKNGTKPIVIIRSGIWGIANEYYTRKCGERGKDLTFIYGGIKNDSLLYQSTKEWEDYVKRDLVNTNLSFVDRIYWELREGCWLASVEQSFDVMDGITSIQIFNCRMLIGALLGFPLEDRLRKEEENKITHYACPALTKVPYDYQYEKSFKIKLLIKAHSFILSCKKLFT